MLGTVTKQPADVLDYDIDFSQWLPADDAVLSVTTAVEPTGVLVVDYTQVLSPTVKVWVSGGTDGSTYKVTLTATTDGGRVKQEEFKVRVKDR